MDSKNLDTLLESMSDEELLKLLKNASGTEEPVTKPPEKIKVSLPDGSVVEGKDQEEVNKLLRAKLETALTSRREEPTTPPPAPQTPPKWDYNTFAKKFSDDPREGMEYFETANYGMPVGKVVPQLLSGLLALAQEVQSMRQEQFVTSVPDEESRRATEQIMKERGWAPSRQAFQDALDIAKGRGMVKSQEHREEEKPRTPFIPPRTRSNSSDPEVTAEEIARAAGEMPFDKLEDLLISKGFLSRRS